MLEKKVQESWKQKKNRVRKYKISFDAAHVCLISMMMVMAC